MTKKILILGANGMAGHVIRLGLQKFPNKFEIISLARNSADQEPTIKLDISEYNVLKDLINNLRLDCIINCIGILNSTAENNPANAIFINSYLPHFLENITKGTKTKVIHLSTDCVFKGDRGSYVENDFKDGIGFYAQSKALGELINNKDLTIRTSIIGPELSNNGIGLFDWFLRQQGVVQGYSNAIWSGVTTIELMKAISHAIDSDLCGLYHLVNNDSISKYDLLKLVDNSFKSEVTQIIRDQNYNINKSLLNTRSDFDYIVPSYSEMILALNTWVKNNKELYPFYNPI